jgi:hypothetical protein
VGEAQHIVQEQRGPLAWRQALQGGHEGQADLLTADYLILRVTCPVQVGVADWLDPRQFGVGGPGHRAGSGGQPVTGRTNAGPLGTKPVEADVGCDALQPGAERPRAVVGGQLAPRPLERVLGGILCVGA